MTAGDGSVELTEHLRPPSPGPEARRVAKALTWSALVLFCMVALALDFGGGLPLTDALLLSALLAAVPVLAIAQLPLIDGFEIERLPAYWSSIATLWVLAAACWLVGTRDGGAAAVGLVGLPPVPLLGWTLALTGGGLLLIAFFHAFARWAGIRDSQVLRQLLPRTTRERGVFALLSLTAGTGEELAYRGYAIPALMPVLGVGGAAVLTTAVFGVVHAYQGALGVVRTGLMGGVLAWGFLASGSLWPPILAHILIDLIAGIVIGERLLAVSKEP